MIDTSEIKKQLLEIINDKPKTIDQFCKTLNADFSVVEDAIIDLRNEGSVTLTHKPIYDEDNNLIFKAQFYKEEKKDGK